MLSRSKSSDQIPESLDVDLFCKIRPSSEKLKFTDFNNVWRFEIDKKAPEPCPIACSTESGNEGHYAPVSVKNYVNVLERGIQTQITGKNETNEFDDRAVKNNMDTDDSSNKYIDLNEKKASAEKVIENKEETERKTTKDVKSKKDKPSEQKVYKQEEIPRDDKKKVTETETIEEKPVSKQEKDDDFYIQKVERYINKCVTHIVDMRLKLGEYMPPPDNNNEFQRRIEITREFASEFANTYLYPFTHQLSISGTLPKNYREFAFIFRKIHRALEAFLAHIPSVIGNISYNKLVDYLEKVIQFCRKTKVTFTPAKVLEVQCEDLIDQVMEKISSLKSVSSRKSPAETVNTSTTLAFGDRLAMYKPKQKPRKKGYFNNEQQKVAVSKYQMRPPITVKPHVPSAKKIPVPSPRKFDRRDILTRRWSSLESLNLDKDQIETMIGKEDNTEIDDAEFVEYEGNTMNEQQQTSKSETPPQVYEIDKSVSMLNIATLSNKIEIVFEHDKEKEIDEMVKVFGDDIEHLKGILSKFLDLAQSHEEKSSSESNDNVAAAISLLQKHLKLEDQKQNTSVQKDVGEQNSVILEPAPEKAKLSDENTVENLADETDTIITERKIVINRTKEMSIKKSWKKTLIEVIQYKLDCYKYQKQRNKQFVARKLDKIPICISDKLFDYGLLCAIEDIENDESLKDVFYAKFLYDQ